MSILSLSVKDFLARAASRAAEPGGGALAAIAGASAAAMVSMVGELTIGKKCCRSVEAKVKRLCAKAVTAMHALQEAAVEDGEAFHEYLRVSSLPSDNSVARERRSRDLEVAVARMTSAPLVTAVRCAEVLKLARSLAPIGAVNAISDAGVALQLAYAALQSALLTIDINLPFLRDETLADSIRTRRKSLSEVSADDLLEGMKDISERLSS